METISEIGGSGKSENEESTEKLSEICVRKNLLWQFTSSISTILPFYSSAEYLRGQPRQSCQNRCGLAVARDGETATPGKMVTDITTMKKLVSKFGNEQHSEITIADETRQTKDTEEKDAK